MSNGHQDPEQRATSMSGWHRRLNPWLLQLALAATVLLVLNVPGPVTACVASAAALLVPGAPVAHALALHDPVAWLAVCLTCSLALGSLGSMAMLWSGLWSPGWLAVVIGLASAVALVTHTLQFWGFPEPDL